MNSEFISDETFGKVNIRIEKPKYVCGEQINGFVELSLEKPFPSNSLRLLVSGEESVAIVLRGGDVSEERFAVHKDSHSILDDGFSLYTSSRPTFEVGHYSFPFVFCLRDGLPASFEHTSDELGPRAYARIGYTLRAGLFVDRTALFAERQFAVGARAAAAFPGKRQFTRNLRGWLCASLGEVKLGCEFEANAATVGDELLFAVSLDNRRSNTAIRRVDCRLVQSVSARTADGAAAKTVRRVLAEYRLSGCGAGESLDEERAQLVRLLIDCSPRMQPTTKGTLIKNEYSVEIEAKTADALCCDAQPPHAIPIEVGSVPPSTAEPPFEAKWAPTTFPPYVCAAAKDY